MINMYKAFSKLANSTYYEDCSNETYKQSENTVDRNTPSFNFDQNQSYEPMEYCSGDVNNAFEGCNARFNGLTDQTEEFISAVSIFKDSYQVPEDSALRSLANLFSGPANAWWQEVKHTIPSFKDAMNIIRAAFGYKLPPSKLYKLIFATEQAFDESTESFVAKKRALLNKIPAGDLSERVQLDMVYGLLHISIRKKISREDITSFENLLIKAKEVEDALFEEEYITQILKTPRLSLRSETSLRRDSYDLVKSETESLQEQFRSRYYNYYVNHPDAMLDHVECFSCGRVGYTISECPNCIDNGRGKHQIDSLDILENTPCKQIGDFKDYKKNGKTVSMNSFKLSCFTKTHTLN